MSEYKPYDSNEVVADLVMRHAKDMNAVMIADIEALVEEVFSDGYCRGYNSATAWYTDMDNDIEYIESFEGGGQLVDTFNDDFGGAPYGDIPSVADLELYYEVVQMDINKIDNKYLFNRRNNNE